VLKCITTIHIIVDPSRADCLEAITQRRIS